MDEEKLPKDILREIAKRENWDIYVYEKAINIRYGNYTRRVIIKISELKNIYFISNKSGGDFDKYSFKKNAQRFRTGNSSFDNKVYVETNHEMDTHKLLSSGRIQMEIQDFLNSENLLHIGYNEINPEFTDELKGRQYLSVFMSLGWMLDKSMIDKAAALCEHLKQN